MRGIILLKVVQGQSIFSGKFTLYAVDPTKALPCVYRRLCAFNR